MCLLKVRYGGPQVMTEGTQVGMAKDLGDDGGMRAAAQHLRCAGSAHGVGVGYDSGLFGADFYDMTDALGLNAFPAAIEPEGVGCRHEFRQEAWPRLLEVKAQELNGVFAEWDQALFAELALDLDRGAVEVHVVDGETGRLVSAHAGGVKDFE